MCKKQRATPIFKAAFSEMGVALASFALSLFAYSQGIGVGVKSNYFFLTVLNFILLPILIFFWYTLLDFY